jgi:hypothetical protein
VQEVQGQDLRGRVQHCGTVFQGLDDNVCCEPEAGATAGTQRVVSRVCELPRTWWLLQRGSSGDSRGSCWADSTLMSMSWGTVMTTCPNASCCVATTPLQPSATKAGCTPCICAPPSRHQAR